eukprot:TRINITY_DN1829_c0_g1_i8.p1 TRINITY_DN1829_c0_g1~~TRINITY_DN1829_c0_g1_i8.p1  ORF type:complete len:304 (-),score=22.47 TRINITY_DN1829_c0_g1_i8:84-995(-)
MSLSVIIPRPARCLHRLAKLDFVTRDTAAKMSTSQRETTFFLGNGNKIDKETFLEKIADSKAKVIMVGENHEDSTAHQLELDILIKLNNARTNKTGLSLEFYDRESQIVLNEYLSGMLDVDTWLEYSRPPANYADYQPLIDFCKTNSLPALASNCPRRYTRMVSRNGKEYLNQLKNSSSATLLPPLPYSGASEAYTKNFIDIMQKMGNTNPNVPTKMLDAQSLWDATMAHSLAGFLDQVDSVLHVTGYFHIQHKLGTVEHFHRYAPGVDILTVVILPSEQLDALNTEQLNIGDLVALTDIDTL